MPRPKEMIVVGLIHALAGAAGVAFGLYRMLQAAGWVSFTAGVTSGGFLGALAGFGAVVGVIAFVGSLISVAFAALVLVAAIAFLRFKPWARIFLQGLTWYHLGSGALGVLSSLYVLGIRLHSPSAIEDAWLMLAMLVPAMAVGVWMLRVLRSESLRELFAVSPEERWEAMLEQRSADSEMR